MTTRPTPSGPKAHSLLLPGRVDTRIKTMHPCIHPWGGGASADANPGAGACIQGSWEVPGAEPGASRKSAAGWDADRRPLGHGTI